MKKWETIFSDTQLVNDTEYSASVASKDALSFSECVCSQVTPKCSL